eukprot:5504890-Pleurochrysis_carterae.AAC.1
MNCYPDVDDDPGAEEWLRRRREVVDESRLSRRRESPALRHRLHAGGVPRTVGVPAALADRVFHRRLGCAWAGV